MTERTILLLVIILVNFCFQINKAIALALLAFLSEFTDLDMYIYMTAREGNEPF